MQGVLINYNSYDDTIQYIFTDETSKHAVCDKHIQNMQFVINTYTKAVTHLALYSDTEYMPHMLL